MAQRTPIVDFSITFKTPKENNTLKAFEGEHKTPYRDVNNNLNRDNSGHSTHTRDNSAYMNTKTKRPFLAPHGGNKKHGGTTKSYKK